MSDITHALQQAVEQAAHNNRPLNITGSGSKSFYGRPGQGTSLDVSAHRGISLYEPSELVMTARCGTPLSEIESALSEAHQMLPFEPPYFGPHATLGGCIACGLSGPRRPFGGAVRDCVLGCTLINGRAEIVSFGGRVMKNVAGYDLSRLMVGAMGTLGLLLSISFRVTPTPAEEVTVRQEMDPDRAIEVMNRWAGQPLPLSALCHDGRCLYARLSGAAPALAAARKRLGGERVDNGAQFWQALREHRLGFFQGAKYLWRLSLAPATPMLALPGDWLLDWGGAQRWLTTNLPSDAVFQAAAQVRGHATLFRSSDRNQAVFQPLPSALMAIHTRLKQAFDPQQLFNPKRLYPEW